MKRTIFIIFLAIAAFSGHAQLIPFSSLDGNQFNKTPGNGVSIKSDAPLTNMVLKGSTVQEQTVITTSATLSRSTHSSIVVCSNTGGAITVTLPDASSVPQGTYWTIYRGSQLVTIDTTSSQTIDGVTSIQLLMPNQHVTVISEGVNKWRRISVDPVVRRIQADLLADDTYSGTVLAGVAGEALSQWDVVYMNTSGKFVKADADSAGAYPAWGVVTAAALTDEACDILIQGVIRNDAWAWGTVGGVLFLSTTAGGLTLTAPTSGSAAVQPIARARSSTSIFINVTPHYATTVP